MAIRVQPAEVAVPEDNPFVNDALEREASIKVLTTLLGSVSGPCVMAVDAGWGMGKTTFLQMWAQFLRIQGFPVVEFNAWRTDFSHSPFIALSTEVTAALSDIPSINGRAPLHRLKKAAADVASVAGMPTARLVSSAIPLIGGQLAKELSDQPLSQVESKFAAYAGTKQIHYDFEQRLGEVAVEVAANSGGCPLVVMIDELDRCRPTYAIELLETAKHLFSVDNVVFVLCLDQEQLAHSVRAVYGSQFGAERYLRRFFDFDYQLPVPSRGRLVTSTLDSLGVTQRLHQADSLDTPPTRMRDTLARILDNRALSLRDMVQTTHRLAMILLSLPRVAPSHICTLAVLLVLRRLDTAHYRRLIAGHATDAEAVSVIDGEPSDPSKVSIEVEAIICMTVWYCARDDSGERKADMTPRYNHYQTLTQKNHINSMNATRHEVWRATAVIGATNELLDEPLNSSRFGRGAALHPETLRTLIRHLELFPDDMDERAAL